MLDLFKKKSNLYNAFLKDAKVIADDENCITYSLKYGDRQIVLKKTLKKATKSVIATCSGHAVSAVHLYPVTHHTVATEQEFNVDVADIKDSDSIAIVVISGKPGLITGLDEGIFVSANRQAKDKGSVYVMSEARFKNFELKE